MGIARVKLIAEHLRHKLFNLQSKSRAFEVGEQHYDAGNDVFEAKLIAEHLRHKLFNLQSQESSKSASSTTTPATTCSKPCSTAA